MGFEEEWERELKRLQAERPELSGEVGEALRRGLNALKAAEKGEYRELLENQLQVLNALSSLSEARYAYNNLLNELVNRVRRSRGR